MEDRNDGALYWINSNEKEQEYDEILNSDEFWGSPFLESINQSPEFDDDGEDEDSGSNKLQVSPQQEGDLDSSPQSSPLGLKLKKTPSLINLLETMLSKGKQTVDIIQDSNQQQNQMQETKIEDLGSQFMYEKLKASNFPATYIKIGKWQWISRHEGDLIAKLYYAKRKMVWEVLNGPLKSKIEIQWSDITAIRATMPENEEGTLEIELNQPPLFYQETNPQPRKHTLWQQSVDFTGGQASVWRRHYVRFPPGILDKHYEKLLQNDKALFALNLKPFPSQSSPFFDRAIFGASSFSLSFNGSGSGSIHGNQFPHRNWGGPLGFTPHPPTSDMNLPCQPRTNQQDMNWGQGRKFLGGNFNLQATLTQNERVLIPQNYQSQGLNGIPNHLLGDNSQIESSNEGPFLANIDPMDSYMEPINMNKERTITSYSEINDQAIYTGRVLPIASTQVRDLIYSDPWMSSQDCSEGMEIEPINGYSIPSHVPSNQINNYGNFQRNWR